MSATADEVLEAMARGIGDEIGGSCMRQQGNCGDAETCQCQRAARAAIRGLPPGWVVAQVPDNEPICGSKDSAEQMLRAEGYNDALAAIRASAVGG